MSAALGALYSRRSRNSALWAALALSLALHALLMLGWLPLVPPPFSGLGDPQAGKRGGTAFPLAVRLAERPASTGTFAVAPSPAPAPRRPAPRAESAPKSAPRVLQSERGPSPLAALPPAESARPPGRGGDFLADLAARRSAREQAEQREAPSPAAPLSFGAASGPGGALQDGGIFRIERMTPYDASLAFYRTNRDVQRVEVGVGNNLSIQLAVVRAVIAVMRESGFTGDVTWMSQRLGRDVQLSARERDSVQLEAFLLLEFFSADPIRRPPDTAGAR